MTATRCASAPTGRTCPWNGRLAIPYAGARFHDEKIEMPDPLPIIDPKSQFRRFADLIRQDDNTAAQLIAVAVHCLIHPAGPSSQPPLVLLEPAGIR